MSQIQICASSLLRPKIPRFTFSLSPLLWTDCSFNLVFALVKSNGNRFKSLRSSSVRHDCRVPLLMKTRRFCFDLACIPTPSARFAFSDIPSALVPQVMDRSELQDIKSHKLKPNLHVPLVKISSYTTKNQHCAVFCAYVVLASADSQSHTCW